MQEWLQGHGWSLDEAEVFLALLALVGGTVAGIWKIGLHKVYKFIFFNYFLADRSYASWFVRTWDQCDNPYLFEIEDFDFFSTYVPLSFHGEDSEVRTDAWQVLHHSARKNIIIQGDPGSGKSTLLRAYGVNTLTRQRRIWRRGPHRSIIFLIPLRRFARSMTNTNTALSNYLIDDILVSGWGKTRKDAEAFLRRVLQSRRAVILLDGLDEVPTDRQDRVLEAVYQFSRDRNPHIPTAQARLVVTCRRQNFIALRDTWTNIITGGVYTLAPLRDADIYSYLVKMRTQFQDQRYGPEKFLQAIRASGTIDLHRIPLILSMSVGLYAKKPGFDIPNDIADLYSQMITEMLERQRFRNDPGTGTLRFSVADKARFLREFATGNADHREGCGERYGEFSRSDLSRYAEELMPHLDAVDDHRSFIDEIVNRSGLIVDAGDGAYLFAHRSVQEFLVAEHLRHYDPNGADILLNRATDPTWRQVVLFYTCTDQLGQHAVDTCMLQLADRDVALAGHCLAGAKVTTSVAEHILEDLARRVRGNDEVLTSLASILSAIRSPRHQIRDVAAALVRDLLHEIIDHPEAWGVLSGDLYGVVRIVRELSHMSAVHAADLVPTVISAVPDDPRLVEPLWLCLAIAAMEAQPGTARIVERLLTLVMTPAGLAELQRQEPHSPDFATRDLRRRVYPFHRGHARDSNLVTLLCWADYLNVIPIPPNRFFEARAQDPHAFSRVENDRRGTRSIAVHKPASLMSLVGLLGAVAVSIRSFVMDLYTVDRWGGPLVLWWLVLPVVTVPVAFFLCDSWAREQPSTSFPRRYFRAGAAPGTGNSGNRVAEICARVTSGSNGQLLFLLTTPWYAIAALPLLNFSSVGYIAASVGANALCGWIPFLAACDRDTQIYLYHSHRVSDVYDDDRSLLWLDPTIANTSEHHQPTAPRG